MARTPALPKTSRALAMASICVVIAALYFGREVLIPLAVSLLLTFLLAPVAQFVERSRLPRAAAVLLVVALSFLLIGGLIWMIYEQANDLALQLTKYRGDIEQMIQRAQSHLGHGAFAQASKEFNRVAQDVSTSQPSTPNGFTFTPGAPLPVVVTSPDEASSRALNTLSSAVDWLTPLAKALIIVVFVIFMLMRREDLRDRLIRLIGHGQLTVTTQALDEAGRRVSKYLLAQSMINGSFGLVIGTGLWFLHIPNAPLWGLICGILRFIPYLGVWIGAAFPIILSLVVPGGSFARPFITIGMFVIVELSVGNFLEPWLYGTSTGVSSVAILVAAVFWTWLWGTAGLLLSTPLTVVLAVMGKYVPQLEFLTVILGDQPVLKPHERYYQRLLADAPDEASDLIEEFEKTQSREQIYSEIMLPTMQMAERDYRRGVLEEDRRDFIRESLLDEIETLRNRDVERTHQADAAEATAAAKNELPPDPSATAKGPGGAAAFALPKDCVVNVLCLPANDPSDDIAGQMLAHLLELQGYCARALSSDALASEMVDAIEKEKADVVVVSALPPGAVAHARYLCKRAHARFPKMRMIIGLWNSQGDLARSKARIACADSVTICSSFAVALNDIHQSIQPLLLRSAEENEAAPAQVTAGTS